jgi:hypothetical protein
VALKTCKKRAIKNTSKLKEPKATSNDDHCPVDGRCLLLNNDLFLGEGRTQLPIHQHSCRILVEKNKLYKI